MRLLIKDRGKGKTTGLIYTSEATGYPIVTSTEIDARYIKDMAQKMGCKIPDPITINTLRNNKAKYLHIDCVLIDDVERILEDALNTYLGCEVKCATMTNT